jgi:hypothetical protein
MIDLSDSIGVDQDKFLYLRKRRVISESDWSGMRILFVAIAKGKENLTAQDIDKAIVYYQSKYTAERVYDAFKLIFNLHQQTDPFAWGSEMPESVRREVHKQRWIV